MWRVAALTAAGMLLAACTSSSGKPAAVITAPNGAIATSAFLSTMHESFPGVDDAQSLRLAHDFCLDFDNGVAWEAEIKASIDAGFTAYQSGQLVGDAIASFCPQYEKLVPGH